MSPITREQAAELAIKAGAQVPQGSYPNAVLLYPQKLINLLTDFRQQVIADLARGSGAMPKIEYRLSPDSKPSLCDAEEVRESIVSLKAKLEQSEARARKIREAVDDAAYEWSQYVEVDRAPMTLQKYIVQAIDAALNKEPGHEA